MKIWNRFRTAYGYQPSPSIVNIGASEQKLPSGGGSSAPRPHGAATTPSAGVVYIDNGDILPKLLALQTGIDGLTKAIAALQFPSGLATQSSVDTLSTKVAALATQLASVIGDMKTNQTSVDVATQQLHNLTKSLVDSVSHHQAPKG